MPQDSVANTSKAVKLQIPFFAYLKERGLFGNKKVLVIVVQAENTVSGIIIGYLDKKGKKGVANLNEIERINSAHKLK